MVSPGPAELKVMLVSVGEPAADDDFIRALVSELERRRMRVLRTSVADAEHDIDENRPHLVVLCGTRGAAVISTLLDDGLQGTRPRLVVTAPRAELAKLQGLNRNVVAGLLASDLGERLVVERLQSLARQAAHLRQGSWKKAAAAGLGAVPASGSMAPRPSANPTAPEFFAGVDSRRMLDPLFPSSSPEPPASVDPASDSKAREPEGAEPASGSKAREPERAEVASDSKAREPEPTDPEARASEPGMSVADFELEPADGAGGPVGKVEEKRSPASPPRVATPAPGLRVQNAVPQGAAHVSAERSAPPPLPQEVAKPTPPAEAARPEVARPEVARPEAAAPETVADEATMLDAAILESLPPEALTTDAPDADAPTTEAPTSEATDAPTTEVTEAPEARRTEVAEAPTTEGLATNVHAEAAVEASAAQADANPVSADANPDSVDADADPDSARGQVQAAFDGAKIDRAAKEIWEDPPVFPPPAATGADSLAAALPKTRPGPRKGKGVGVVVLLGVAAAAIYVAMPKGAPAERAQVQGARSESAAESPAEATKDAGASPDGAEQEGAVAEGSSESAAESPGEEQADGTAQRPAAVVDPLLVVEADVKGCDAHLQGFEQQMVDPVQEASLAWKDARDAIVKGTLELAEQKMCEAVQLHPESAALEGLATLYLTQRAPKRALGYLDKAEAVRPATTETINLRGDILSQLGDAEGALAAWLRALKLDPEDTNRRRATAREFDKQGQGHLRRGAVPQAERWFRRAAGLDPENIVALNGLAEVMLQTKRAAQAEAMARRALEVSEYNPQAHVVLGDVARQAGDIAAARVSYERALQVRSDHWHAKARLRELAQEQ